MVKETKYNGYTAVPSDYACPDGDLATAVNIIPEDGALQPVLPPKVLFTLSSTQKVLYIHTTSAYTHYIVYDSSNRKLYWMDSTARKLQTTDAYTIGSHIVTDINSIGNTLLIFTEDSINYYLWKQGAYNKLGDHLPEISLSFGLIGHPRLYSLVKEDGSTEKRGTFDVSYEKIPQDDIYDTFSDKNKSQITSQVMAKVNKFIAEQTVNKGRFCFPFFVRWAYRLYDGSHTMHSAPVLMTPSTTAAPLVICNKLTGEDGKLNKAVADIMMVAADLDYCFLTQGDYAQLDRWKDIIAAIDVYISKPIYTYDQSGEVERFVERSDYDSKFIGRLYNGEKDMDTFDTTLATEVTEDRVLAPFSSTSFMSYYMEWTYNQIYTMYFSKDRTVPSISLRLAEFSIDKMGENIESTSSFFKLATIDLDDLEVGKRKTITVKDDYLQSLTNRETMTDDYLSHDRLMAKSSHAYNSRLNLSGVKRDLFPGFVAHAMFPYCDRLQSISVSSNNTITVGVDNVLSEYAIDIYVYIRENGEVYCVHEDDDVFPYLRKFIQSLDIERTQSWAVSWLGVSFTTLKVVTSYNFSAGTKTEKIYDPNGNLLKTTVTANSYWQTAFGSWLFYPNTNAFKIRIKDTNEYICDLKAHDYLNGAYAFLGFTSERGGNTTATPTVTDADNIVSVPNKIYTSDVNNPFYFPVTGINTVGTGQIMGICTAAKALSQGQFGQFPLYAFSTDGVWALEVSSTGSYSAKQPITRDVCINAASLTQMDTSVLFATDRGIMQISGSNTVCLTDTIDTEYPFAFGKLPAADKLIAAYNKGVSNESDKLSVDKLTLLPFRTFLKSCRMVYDYTHQRIIVYNPSCNYAYVYSILSTAWGMMRTNIVSDVNSYPDALAMDSNSNFVSISESDADSVRALWVTRPFKFDDPDTHKTIDAIIQRGEFRTGHVAQALYGSNNLYDWHLIWTSADQYLRGFRGTPYKYYRLAIIASLSADESVYGFTSQYTPRLTNQPR